MFQNVLNEESINGIAKKFMDEILLLLMMDIGNNLLFCSISNIYAMLSSLRFTKEVESKLQWDGLVH